MLSSIARFLRDEEGATAIEYGIIAGLISIAIVTVLNANDGLGAPGSRLHEYHQRAACPACNGRWRALSQPRRSGVRIGLLAVAASCRRV
jgi:pilus assembly protein Flp/PilA